MVRQAFALPCACLLAGALALAADDAQPPADEAARFFDAGRVQTLHLTVSAADWAVLQQTRPQGPPRQGGPPDFARGVSQPGSNDRVLLPPSPGAVGSFTYVHADLEFQGVTCKDVGLRLKGNSSLRFSAGSLKTPFKLDFNRFDKGRKFMGLASVHLNINAMDPSGMRESLAYSIFRQAGIPCSRSAYARVYLTVPGTYDRNYLGLYILVEDVNKVFVNARLGTDKGLLVKPERAANLPYLGDQWKAYERLYELKIEGDAMLQKRFVEFLRLVHEADDDTFGRQIAAYMDVGEFLRFIAVNGLISNMDSFLCTGHNFCLYLHPETRRIVWIPWDLNEAFAGFTPAGSVDEQINLSIDQPYTGANRLLERVLAIPEHKRAYREFVAQLMRTAFEAETLSAAIASTQRLIAAAVAEEKSAAQSPGRNDGIGGPPDRLRPQKPALDFFIAKRSQSVTDQLAGRSNGSVLRMQGPFGGPGDAEALARDLLLQMLDTSGDRELSAEEITDASASLKKLDRNADGAIDRNELLSPRRREEGANSEGDGQRRPPSAAERKSIGGSGDPGAPLAPDRVEARRAPGGPIGPGETGPRFLPPDILIVWALDSDGDGTLSPRELACAPASLRRLDKNGDDVIDRNELRLPAIGPVR